MFKIFHGADFLQINHATLKCIPNLWPSLGLRINCDHYWHYIFKTFWKCFDREWCVKMINKLI